MRRMRTNEWWDDRLDDIAVLRAGLNARDIDGTDAQIAEAYGMWSDEFYAAGWVSVGDTAPPSFVGWVEREWLAPASGEPSGADAAVREAPPISDTAVARIIEDVEAHCGMGHGAWDMVAARDLVEGFAAALGADTRRVNALEARGCVELVQNADGTWDIDPDPDLHARFPSLRAAIDGVLLPTVPGAPEEGAGE